MLRVAVPNKGSLSEAASAMLAEAGYRQRRDSRELVMVDPDNDIEFFFLRPRDIAVYVGQRGINAKVVRLDGAVESSVRLGVADAIADVVETGTTLKAAGMEIFGEPILNSESVLIGRKGEQNPATEVLIRRLQGVLVARQYVMMDYDIRKELVEQAAALTPGLESPTVSPLRDSDWVAVRSMVPKRDTNRIMDELYDLGARAILVSSIHACRI